MAAGKMQNFVVFDSFRELQQELVGKEILYIKPEKVEIVDAPIKRPKPTPPTTEYIDARDALFYNVCAPFLLGFPLVIGPGYIAPARQPQCTPGLPGPQKAF
jgi:hypothetical protein